MAGRPASGMPADSDSSSSVGIPAVSVNKNSPHPEEWTLPHEWNIEKREMYDSWKMDVQNQISNLATNLDRSLTHYPHPEVGSRFDYQDETEKAKREKARILGLSYVPRHAAPMQ